MPHKQRLVFSLLAITLISGTLYFVQQSGVYTYNIHLEDGEYISTNAVINDMGVEELITSSDRSVFNSALVRSFDTDTNQVLDFINYANHVGANRNLGYWSNTPILYYDDEMDNNRVSDPIYAFTTVSGLDFDKAQGFPNYYHRIFQNKTARSVLLNQTIEYVCLLCKRYPTDFKIGVLNELDLLIQFTQRLGTLGPNTNTDYLRNYWEGFIYRRYVIDHIPPSEIEESLTQAKNKIKAIEVSSQPRAMYEIIINNTITLLYSSETLTVKSKISGKEIRFNYDTFVDKVRYLKDGTGEYYQIMGTKNNQPFSTLYNVSLVSIE
jgi:hypothetical protein